MSTLRQIFSNTVVQVAGKVVTGLLGVITIKLLTGYFDKAMFGDYTVVFEFLAFFGIMADMGLFTIAVREMSRPGAKAEKVLGNILAMRIVLALLALGAAVLVAFSIPKYGYNVEMGVLISAFSMIAAFVAGSSSTILQAEMKMHWQVLGLILGKVATVTAIVLGVIFSQHFLYFMVAGLIGNMVYMLIVVGVVSRLARIRLCFDWTYWKFLIRTALPYGLALVLSTIYFRIDSVMLYQMVGSEATATYGVAVKFLEILVVVPVFFLNSTLPTLTRYITESSQKITRLVQLAFDFLSASGLAIAGGVLVLAVPFILFISRPDYVDAALPLQILMFAMLASFLNSLFGYILVATNKQAKLLWINLICVIINITTNLYAIPRWSYAGAAVTSIISEVFILVMLTIVALPLIKVRISLVPFLKMLMATAAMIIVLYLLPHDNIVDLGLAVPTGAVVYLGILWGTKALDREAVKEVLKMKGN